LNDRDIDKLLNGAKVPSEPKAETLGRIAESIAGSMRPVRPMPSRWVLTVEVALICALVALAGAAGLGFAGIARMSVLERGAVFSVLVILVVAAATELVSAMIPASRRRFSSGRLLGVVAVCLAAVLALCFRDYQTTRFIHAGLVCLGIGLMHAVATGLLSWLLLRRGFAVDAISAGLGVGILSGLAGVGMLELHCANFQAAHVLVWHVGVLLVSAGAGAMCAWGMPAILTNRGRADK
jgi:Negative regulator of sigma F